MSATESQAFVGKAYVAVSNGASPEVFTRYCEIDTISGIGGKNALVDVTTFCSPGGWMQYIPGLTDGNEVTLSANYVLDGPDATIQDALIDDCDAKITRSFTLEMGDASPTQKTYHLSMAMISWELAPSVSKQNVIKFVGKITGPILTT